MEKQGTLDDAATIVGLTREAVYRVVVKEGRIPAKLIRSCRNGRTRPRWMMNLKLVQAYFSDEIVLRENGNLGMAKGGKCSK